MPSSSPSGPQPTTRLRDRLREETARAILGAAEDVFASEGLGARMETIAAHAGVAVGTLYNHFRDRKALVAALWRSRQDALLALVDEAVAQVRADGAEPRLRAFLGAVEQHCRAHGPFLHVMIQAPDGPSDGRGAKPLVDELIRRAQPILDQGIAAGELRPDPARILALAFVGYSRAVAFRVIEGGTEPGQAADALLELFLTGVRASQ